MPTVFVEGGFFESSSTTTTIGPSTCMCEPGMVRLFSRSKAASNFGSLVGLKLQELRRAQELVREHRDLILEKWHEHLD